MDKARLKFGKFLKKAREGAGLTQWNVACELDYVTAQFISNWERGVSLPPADAVPVICRIYRLKARVYADHLLELRLAEARDERKMLLASSRSPTPTHVAGNSARDASAEGKGGS